MHVYDVYLWFIWVFFLDETNDLFVFCFLNILYKRKLKINKIGLSFCSLKFLKKYLGKINTQKTLFF